MNSFKAILGALVTRVAAGMHFERTETNTEKAGVGAVTGSLEEYRKLSRSEQQDVRNNSMHIAQHRVEHLLKLLIFEVIEDFADSWELVVFEYRSVPILFPSVYKDAVVNEKFDTFLGLLREKLTHVHTKDALTKTINHLWTSKFVEVSGGKLRLKHASKSGSIEENLQVRSDTCDAASVESGSYADSKLMEHLLNKFIQTDISCVQGGPFLEIAKFLGVSSEQDAKKDVKVQILQTADSHTIVSVKCDRLKFIELVEIVSARLRFGRQHVWFWGVSTSAVWASNTRGGSASCAPRARITRPAPKGREGGGEVGRGGGGGVGRGGVERSGEQGGVGRSRSEE